MKSKTNGFLAETLRQISLHSAGSVERAALRLLTRKGVGRLSAITGKQLETALKRQGYSMNKYAFQKALVAPSRKKDSGWYIGSSRRGFFIIQDFDDVVEAARYATSRIKAQQINLGNLFDQADGYRLALPKEVK